MYEHEYMRTQSLIFDMHDYVIATQKFLSFISFYLQCSIFAIFMPEITEVNQRTGKFPTIQT